MAKLVLKERHCRFFCTNRGLSPSNSTEIKGYLVASLLTQPWFRYELLATLGRLSDWNLMDHSVRCSYAAGDLRAHAQLILEELPENTRSAIGSYLNDEWEADSIAVVRSVLVSFFEGGHWSYSLLPPKDDPLWAKLMHAAEEARRAVIMNGLPAWKEDANEYPDSGV